MPAKIFEYLATSLPILYLSDGGDDVAAMLAGQPGVFVVGRADVPGVRAVLEAHATPRLYERDPEPFSRRVRAAELAAVLDAAVDQT